MTTTQTLVRDLFQALENSSNLSADEFFRLRARVRLFLASKEGE